MISLGKIGTPRSRSRWETALLLKVTKIFLQNGRSTSALFSTMIMVKCQLICHNELLRTCQSTITHLHLRRHWKPFAKWRRNKAAGLDCAITAEALQDGGDAMADVIHCFCAEVYSNLTPPDQWITSVIVPLPKKGDLSLMTNLATIGEFLCCQ